VEDVGVRFDPSSLAGKRVLVTGHTGFKGAWLSLWLERAGAKVTGYSRAADTEPSLFALSGLADRIESVIGDVCDRSALERAYAAAQPEVVFHMAAQALVRRSYRDPIDTIATNVMGTTNVLDLVRASKSVRAVVIVTSDKCYENREQIWAYRETDAMGGHDPYSASKGCAELLTAAYRDSYLRAAGVAVGSARAGNVIGGGDWAEDRLIPDIVRAATVDGSVSIRNPASTRPWQHVLEPLSGYLQLAQGLLASPARFAGAWNFGPDDTEDGVAVGPVAQRFVSVLGRGRLDLAPPDPSAPHEARLLRVDSSKAKIELGWRPRLGLRDAIDWTASWYRDVWLTKTRDAVAAVHAQLSDYEARGLSSDPLQ
jgi:CDP-glucose 4,6-dehydratase